MIPPKSSFIPLTIICAKNLFWFVKRPKIYYTAIFKDELSNNIRN